MSHLTMNKIVTERTHSTLVQGKERCKRKKTKEMHTDYWQLCVY